MPLWLLFVSVYAALFSSCQRKHNKPETDVAVISGRPTDQDEELPEYLKSSAVVTRDQTTTMETKDGGVTFEPNTADGIAISMAHRQITDIADGDTPDTILLGGENEDNDPDKYHGIYIYRQDKAALDKPVTFSIHSTLKADQKDSVIVIIQDLTRQKTSFIRPKYITYTQKEVKVSNSETKVMGAFQFRAKNLGEKVTLGLAKLKDKTILPIAQLEEFEDVVTPTTAGSSGDSAQEDGIVDTWTKATSLTSAPSARSSHTAVWSGTEMIVWGGGEGQALNTGALYNP